jgi:voltage-gated potassium channel
MFFFIKLFRNKFIGSLRASKIKALIVFLCLLWYTSSGFLYFELEFKPDLGWSDAIWWSLVTMATVGYGDLFPTTFYGRFLVGIPAIIFGIGFLGYLITSVASKLVETRSRRLQGMCAVEFSNHIIIFNYTRMDEIISLITELRSDPLMKNKKVCLVDEKLDEIPVQLTDIGVHFVKGSPTDIDILNRAGLSRATHAIVLAKDRLDHHSDDQNLVTVMVIEKINSKVFSIVEVIDKRKKQQFELAGANDVICLGELSVSLISREILDPGVNSIIMDLTSNASGSEMYIVDIIIHENNNFRNLQLSGLEKNVSVIGIFREGKPLVGCLPDVQIKEGDRAIIVGNERISGIAV